MANAKIRDSAQNAIKRCLKASSDEELIGDLEAVEVRLEILNEQWRRFSEAQQALEAVAGAENEEIIEQARCQTESWYVTAAANLRRALKTRAKPTQATESEVKSASVVLPKIDIPTFDGSAIDWIAFRDVFQSLIHTNAHLSGSQKLHYLRAALKGEAWQLISSFKISNANYEPAWDCLQSRYQVIRVLVEHHLRAIFAVQVAPDDSARAIRGVIDVITQHVRALGALGRPVEFWDDWLVHAAVSRLAFETRKQWELSLCDDKLPTFEDLQWFLQVCCRSLEMLRSMPMAETSSSKVTQRRQMNVMYSQQETESSPVHVATVPKLPSICVCCSANHRAYACVMFNRLDLQSRLRVVREKRGCFNCLDIGHYSARCPSASNCRTCGQRHHTMLHSSFLHNRANTEIRAVPSDDNGLCNSTTSCPTINEEEPTSSTLSGSCLTNPERRPRGMIPAVTALVDPSTDRAGRTDDTVLLATASVLIQDYSGRWQRARVLLDTGSHVSLITEACAQRLHLSRRASDICITGVGNAARAKTKGEITVILASHDLNIQIELNALILSRITNDLPTTTIGSQDWPHLHGLPLADPQFANPAPIDILIGAGDLEKIVTEELRKGRNGAPLAQNTAFGWVLFGRVNSGSNNEMGVHSVHVDTQLTKAVAQLWELDQFPEVKHLTTEERLCEQHFEATHRRTDGGRFIVELPFKEEVHLGESRSIAARCLQRLERRFSNDKALMLSYEAFMNELITMGHMEPVYTDTADCYYMPHHAVQKETSTTTKLRVVFNASMKTSNGSSLNDALMVGPQLQQDLVSILIRFRAHKYAMTADVEKMYRQVLVADKHLDYQRVLWRASAGSPPQSYRLLRVTYGVASSSYVAVKAMQQTAKLVNEVHQRAANVILEDFYMDDLLTGASSEDVLCQLQKDVSYTLAQGGFNLRKWATNCSRLSEEITSAHASQECAHVVADEDEVRTLGLLWNTQHDTLTFAVYVRELPEPLTKRMFLSDTSRLYDPLGLLAPVTIVARIWLQELWRSKIEWDEPIPSTIAKQWLEKRSDLAQLTSLNIERWIGTGFNDADTELHVFADASERAYAAVAYTRTIGPNGVTIRLIAAKAKVSPLKSTTLPRLELCAAHLAARLVKQVLASLGKPPYTLYGWTDSTVTLAWLQGQPSQWNTFVANRVAAIQEIVPSCCWAHVASENNPADCASRGLTASKLLQHSLWWNGPHFLRDDVDTRKRIGATTHQMTEEESRQRVVVTHVAEPSADEDWLARYSSYSRLKRVTAYMLRFVYNAGPDKSNDGRLSGPLSCRELRNAEAGLIRYAQLTSFANEIHCCRSNKAVPLRSSLSRLQPFLDARSILRVGGRLTSATVSFDAKHPVVLPRSSTLVKIIVYEIHIITLHGGPQLMQAVLQHRYWIAGARNVVRSIYHQCVKCRRLNRRPQQQQMGDLPISRTRYSRCFLRSAVDFAGPYAIKFSAGRGAKAVKAYISVFICMGTGAMHLELVPDLTANGFIKAFRRFVNRRGHCQHLHSDNATNFVGADRELRTALDHCMNDETAMAYFADMNVTWHFNPPSAPHMGGYWETGVKRVKYHLKRAINNVLLTYEEFSTLLTEVEACVNSRPLCNHTSDALDPEVLTPGHFIIGEPLKSLPDLTGVTGTRTLHQRWQLLSAMRQHFWRRWHKEYLVSLQQRHKWMRALPDVKEGDVVVIIEEQAPPTSWKLAKVVKCHPGEDGRVRVVTLRNADGECVRPITKICCLPTGVEHAIEQ